MDLQKLLINTQIKNNKKIEMLFSFQSHIWTHISMARKQVRMK